MNNPLETGICVAGFPSAIAGTLQLGREGAISTGVLFLVAVLAVGIIFLIVFVVGRFRIFVVGRVREFGDLAKMRSRLVGKLWEELTEDEHQRMPGDYEAQVSQGAIALHSEEHLATSDRGVVMRRVGSSTGTARSTSGSRTTGSGIGCCVMRGGCRSCVKRRTGT